MRDLVVLCCNPGAKNGDYMEGTLWQLFYPTLKSQAKFAAVDSIISILNDDGLGALVLYPEEMQRVKGFDIKATIELFNPNSKPGKERLEKHTEALKVAIARVFPNYDRVVVALNSEVYKMAMWAAINETNSWDKVVFIDQLAAAFNKKQILRVTQDVLNDNKTSGRIFVPTRPDIARKYMDRWVKYRTNIPERWRYWEDKNYTCVA